MTESETHEPRHAVRFALLATGAGLLWAAVAMFAPADAHAAEGDTGGLVGIVAEATDGATNLVGAVTETVAYVAPPVAPVTNAVSQTVNTAAGTVSTAVQSVPPVVPPVTPVVTPVITEVVQPVVDHVVQPVLDTAAAVTAPVPVVGELVGAVDLSGTVAAVPGVTEAVDTAVDNVLEGPIIGGVLPVPDSPLFPPPAALFDDPSPVLVGHATGSLDSVTLPDAIGVLASTAPVGRLLAAFVSTPGEGSVLALADATTAPSGAPGGFWPSDAAPGSGSGAGSAGGSASVALHASTFETDAALNSVASHSASDRLPACPVFEADTSPD